MIFCGIPIFFQEVAIGQYLGSGGMTLVGKLCPILSGEKRFFFLYNTLIDLPLCFLFVTFTVLFPTGVVTSNIDRNKYNLYYTTIRPRFPGTGYATMTIVFLLDVYYCVIVAWTFFYLASCFTSFPDLPWDNCSKIRTRGRTNVFVEFATRVTL